MTDLKACFEETDRVVERAKLPGVGVDFGKIIEEIVDAEENMLRALSGLIDESLAASECEVPSVPEKTDEHKIQLVAKKTKLEREYKAASACLRAAEKTYDAAKTASKKACEMHAAAKLNSEKANENVARASATKKGGALSKEAEKLQKKTDGLIVIMQTAQAALDDAKQAVSDAKKKEADAKNEFELSEMDIESYATLSARSQESDGGSSLSSSLGLSGRRLSSEPCAFADACVQYKRIVDKAFVSTSAFISNDVYHQEHSMLAIASLELNMVLLALHRISFDGDEDTAIKLNSNTSTEVDDLVQLSVSNRARFVTLAYERINAYAAVYQSCVERDIYAELILVTMGTLKTKADLMLAIGEEYRKSGFLVNFDELEECPLFTKKFVNWKKMEDVRDSMFPLFSFQDWVTCEQFAPIISKVVGSLELIVSDVSRIETAHC